MLSEVLVQPIPSADQRSARVFTMATHMHPAVKSLSHLGVSQSLSLTTGCRKQPGVSHSFTFTDSWLQRTDRGQPYLQISFTFTDHWLQITDWGQPYREISFTFTDHWQQKTDRGQPYLKISYVALQLMLHAVCILLICLHLLLQTATKLSWCQQ